MLRITTSKNASAAIEYFNKALSKQDYYADDGQSIGTWHGKIADQLNLKGQVTKEQFESLVTNRIPNTDIKLTPKDSDNRRAGYDFTFNAPKSISIAHAINRDPRLLAAHQEAVSQAMQAVEMDMQCQNRKRGEDYVTTGNAIYARYDHELSRPVGYEKEDGTKQYIPDPHMHSHAFLFNATFNEKEQKFKAVELGNVKKDAPFYEQYYHAIFRQEVVKAGYEIERTKNAWELKIIDRNMIESFSNRTKEIKKAAAEREITNAKAASNIGAWTRANKNKSAREDEVKEDWNNRLTLSQKYNINAAARHEIQEGEKEEQQLNESKQLTPEKAIQNSLDHWLERESSISEKRVLGEALKSGNFTPEEIKQAYNNREDILGYEENTRRIITTREVLNAEKKIIAHAAQEKGKYQPLNTDYEPVSSKQNFELNEGQKSAVKQVLSSNDGVQVVQGKAGTGKSTIANEIKQGIEANHKKMFAFAPTNEARDVLIREGFDAHTVQKLLIDQALQEKLNGNVMFVDESGQIGVQDMSGIFDISKEQSARVILSGDTSQHSSVRRGESQRILMERSGLNAAQVTEVVRQKNEDYKEAIEDLSEGRVLDGFEKLREMGAINEIENPEERYEQLADDYLNSILKTYENDSGETVHEYSKRKGLVVSPTHREGQKINDVIRQKLKDRNLIDAQEHKSSILQPLHFTEVYKKDPVNYESGMIVKMHYRATGIKAGAQCEVVGKDEEGNVLIKTEESDTPIPLPFDKADKFSVYQKQETSFAKGDTIQLTSNMKSMEGNALNNGNRYKIQEITEEGHRILDNGATIAADQKFIKHGIYSTSMSSQGKTADDVFIAQSEESMPATNSKQFYVSTSRGAKTCQVYTSNADDLLQAVANNDGTKQSALDVAEKGAQQEFEFAFEQAVKDVETYNTKYSEYGQGESTRKATTYDSGVGGKGIDAGGVNGTTPSSPNPS